MSALEQRAFAALEDAEATPAERLAASLTPFSASELEAARTPHPHVFSDRYGRGLFPIGEVTVVGARGREGKTTAMVAIAAALAMERPLAELWPIKQRSTIIYSAEDDRSQYARKVAAQCSILAEPVAHDVRQRILVPDLDAAGMAPLRRLITVAERSPIQTGTAEAIVEATRPLLAGPVRPALLIFETVATLTDAEEDNRTYALLTDTLKRIARALGVAVVLVHHTSQASDSTLADLSMTTASIRGGTSLIYNSRQNALLLNLGSDADPFPEKDGRTSLRELVAPSVKDRITGLITMESSKAQDPAPIWFQWVSTEYGPAVIELEPPEPLIGKSWRKLQGIAIAKRAARAAEGKASRTEESVETAIAAVRAIQRVGKQATANAVSTHAGKSPTWAKPYLEQAVSDGRLIARQEHVQRTKGLSTVYKIADSTAGEA